METSKRSKKIFLVLGIAREPENWKHPIKSLQEALPDFEIIALDNPGMGKNNKVTTPLSIKGHLDFLKKQFDELKGDENYLLGWSMGGMIVAQWSQLYPNDAKGIMLMTTSFGALQLPIYRLRMETLMPVTMAIFSRGEKRERRLYDTICNNKDNKERLIAEWKQTQIERPVKVISILRQLGACTSFWAGSFKQNHPTLIIGAPNDKLVNNKCSEKLAKFWKDAKYVKHATAGHDVFNDAPKWVSNEIKVWVNGVK